MIGHDDPIAIVIHFLHAGRKRVTLPGTEESRTTTSECITALFCQVDDQLAGLPKHPTAHLWPSEVVPLGLLHALKGGGTGPSIAGGRATIGRCSLASPSGRGSFVF